MQFRRKKEGQTTCLLSNTVTAGGFLRVESAVLIYQLVGGNIIGCRSDRTRGFEPFGTATKINATAAWRIRRYDTTSRRKDSQAIAGLRRNCAELMTPDTGRV